MKAKQFFQAIVMAIFSILSLALTSCDMLHTPDPELTDCVVSLVDDSPFVVTVTESHKYNAVRCVIEPVDESDWQGSVTTIPLHLSDEIVPGSEVKYNRRCQKIWKYRTYDGKWKYVTTVESEVK